MTDEELQARLRRLAGSSDKDERFWDEMAANVRAAWAAEKARADAGGGKPAAAVADLAARRRRRWLAGPMAGALALAAALLLWMRVHQHRPTPAAAPELLLAPDEISLFGSDGDEADEMIDELDAPALDRVAQGLKKGA